MELLVATKHAAFSIGLKGILFLLLNGLFAFYALYVLALALGWSWTFLHKNETDLFLGNAIVLALASGASVISTGVASRRATRTIASLWTDSSPTPRQGEKTLLKTRLLACYLFGAGAFSLLYGAIALNFMFKLLANFGAQREEYEFFDISEYRIMSFLVAGVLGVSAAVLPLFFVSTFSATTASGTHGAHHHSDSRGPSTGQSVLITIISAASGALAASLAAVLID